jgi:hypothetical protein
MCEVEQFDREVCTLKKLLTWGGVGLLTTALLDPLLYSMLEQPIPWRRDLLMSAGGVCCLYLLIRLRDSF